MAIAELTGRHGFAYQPALDGLRGIAVVAVILYHLDYPWMGGGFLGVDTFFVLSGYLITSLLLVEFDSTGSVSLRDFWIRRAKRLLPAALLLLVAVATYSWLVAPTDRLETIRGDAIATLTYVANWRFIVDDASYFELWSEASPLRHMWSLAIEEQFYLLWPVVVFGLLKALRGRTTLLIAGCVLAAAGSVVLMAELAETDRSRAYFGTDARVHTILVGALLALVLRRLPPVVGSAARIVRTLGVASLTMLGVSFVVVSDSGAWFYQGGSVIVAVAVAFVIADGVSGSPSLTTALLGWAPLRGLGQISYGLYLWHWPMIVWLTPERLGTDGLALDAIRVAATFGCALVSYVIVEQPIRHRSPSPVAALRAVSVAMTLTALVIVVGTAGSTTNPLDLDADFEIAEATPSPSSASGLPTSTTEPLPASSGADTPTSTTIGSGRVESIALVGDSVAGSLATAMRDAFTGAGFTFFDAHVHGCGVVSGLAVDEAGEPFPWSGECVERVPALHVQLIREHDPDLVLWHSTWETADRLLDETFLEFGTPNHDAALAREIDIVVERLNARGAQVVILVAPPNAPSSFVADPDPARMLHLADQLAIAADRLDALSLVDLNPIVCPGGPPCPERIEGLTLRPDGGHYSEEAAVWLVAQLADALPIG